MKPILKNLARSLAAATLGIAACAACMGPVQALELNQANRAQLESLKGVGVAGAERILVERDKAPFADWSDFMRRTKGVKKGMATRFSHAGVTVNGAAFGSASGAAVTPVAGRSPDPR